MQSDTQRLNSDVLRQWTTIAAIIFTFAVNVLSNIYPLNGLNIGEISNQIFGAVQIIPASYAFAIWGLIYLGLFAFGIYQVRPDQRQDPTLRRVDYWLIVACLVQALWVYFFLSRWFVLSLVAMLGILLPLIGSYLQLGVGQRRRSRAERWFVQIPLSVYLGWITVATVVNVAIALYSLGWNGGGISPEVWTVTVATVSAAIAALIATRHQDVAYTLVIVWALVAIAVRQASQPLISVTTAGLAIALVILITVVKLRRNRLSETESSRL